MKIIFFDGVCGLCNGFIDFVLKIDKKNQFHFSALQSDFAVKNLPEEYTKDLKSVVYMNDGKVYVKSKAVINILSEIGGPWRIFSSAKILPYSLLNTAYDLVATNRYRVFGKKETCRIPTQEERSKFISV
jgi:predicted DCC family thiol-disulfide oxidoreductase YuxK